VCWYIFSRSCATSASLTRVTVEAIIITSRRVRQRSWRGSVYPYVETLLSSWTKLSAVRDGACNQGARHRRQRLRCRCNINTTRLGFQEYPARSMTKQRHWTPFFGSSLETGTRAAVWLVFMRLQRPGKMSAQILDKCIGA